jgi:hypothetical protein
MPSERGVAADEAKASDAATMAAKLAQPATEAEAVKEDGSETGSKDGA